MNNSTFPVNLASHGKYCPDPFCVLPLCVNEKLRASSRNKPTQKNKRGRVTSGIDGHRNGKLQRSELYKDAKLLSQAHLSEDHDDETLSQLLEELEDLEKYFQSGKGDFQCSLNGPSGAASQNANPSLNHTEQKDFQLLPLDPTVSLSQLGNQQPSYAMNSPVSEKRICPTREATVHFLTEDEFYTDEKISAWKFVPRKPTATFAESDDLNLDPEQFISMDPYLCPSSVKKHDTEAESAWSGDQTIKIQSASTAIEEIASSPEDNKEELRETKKRPKQQRQKQPNNTNKLFGILSEILRMLEDPTSVDLEAFYVQVLQKALTEIRGAVAKNLTC